MTEPVRLVPYDPEWPARYEEERRLLGQTIGDAIVGGIHHIGSTAVPGLEAKPVIDILVGVENLDASRHCIQRLERIGYLYAPYRVDEEHWFCKPDPSRRTHHLHLVPHGSPRYEAVIAFRDLLRADPEVRDRYLKLKQRLATEFRDDRELYTQGKADFVAACLA